MKTEVVLKFGYQTFTDTNKLRLMKTEVVLKSFILNKFMLYLLFNENRSCIEILTPPIPAPFGIPFNENRSCIEIL